MTRCDSCGSDVNNCGVLHRMNKKGVDGVWWCDRCINDERVAVEELKSMSREELDLVEYKVMKWVCCCKGCNRGTMVRDYGIFPEVWHPRKGLGWQNLEFTRWFCGVHWPFFKRLSKIYTSDHIYNKIADLSKYPLIEK